MQIQAPAGAPKKSKKPGRILVHNGDHWVGIPEHQAPHAEHLNTLPIGVCTGQDTCRKTECGCAVPEYA